MLKSWKEIPVVAQLQSKMLRKIGGVHSPIINTLLVVWHSQPIDMEPQTDLNFMVLMKRSRITND